MRLGLGDGLFRDAFSLLSSLQVDDLARLHQVVNGREVLALETVAAVDLRHGGVSLSQSLRIRVLP